jgi:hypothetical protein
MTRSHSRLRSRLLATALPVALLLVLAPSGGSGRPALAQEAGKPKKDAALDDLLKELKDTKPPAPAAEAKPAPEKPAPRDALKPSAEPAKDKEKDLDKPKAAPSGGARPAADIAPKDKELDSLLEKLGETPDKPSPDDHRGGGGGMPPPDGKDRKPAGDKDKDKDKDKDQSKEPRPADGSKKPGAAELTGKAKDLDEHLDELTGKRHKKKGGQDDEGSGPMAGVIKEMRDVEQRLGKTDTGEETRKKQQQIVKNLEELIEQMRASSGQPQGKQKRQLAMKPGQQPGQNQPGQNPGTTGGNAPFTKPEKPTTKRSLAGGKDEWGHLPPEDRQELGNASGEEFLPSREELIKRYYDSVARKTVKRGG